jgi:hypothetical protein
VRFNKKVSNFFISRMTQDDTAADLLVGYKNEKATRQQGGLFFKGE